MKKIRKNIFKISVFFITLFSCIGIVNAEGTCPLGPEVTKDLYGVLKIFRIAAPILVIGLSSLEAVRAITKGDGGSDMKKVAQRFGKRAMFAVLLFFLPVLVDQFMQLADVWDANGTCDFEVEQKNPKEECEYEGNIWIEELQECVSPSEAEHPKIPSVTTKRP